MDVGPGGRRRNPSIWTGLFRSEAGRTFFAAVALDKRSAGCHQIGDGFDVRRRLLRFYDANDAFCDGCLE
jgi:hypothetical protein